MHRGKEILLISHGGVLDVFMRMIFNYPLSAPRYFSIYNASINSFRSQRINGFSNNGVISIIRKFRVSAWMS
jgi:broad specificity phosphatase PhoE